MIVSVNRPKCCGHGQCMIRCPEVFGSDEEGYVNLLLTDVPAGLQSSVREGARACPERVISIEE